jgi:hypothetical protein
MLLLIALPAYLDEPRDDGGVMSQAELRKRLAFVVLHCGRLDK